MRQALVFASALLVAVYVAEGNPRRPEVPEPPEDLSPQALVHLDSWLRRVRQDQGVSPPRRNIFRKVTEPGPESPLHVVPPSSPEASRPQLVGFIFAGGPDGEESPSAAVRFEGRMFLVKVGDSVGPYRVKRMVVGEEIELEDAGETIRLLLN
jgi:hypothetical protein